MNDQRSYQTAINQAGILDKAPSPESKATEGDDLIENFLDYKRPWDEVSPHAEFYCKMKWVDARYHHSCLITEEISYWAMHSTYQIPDEYVESTKARCSQIRTGFEGQSVCMTRESGSLKTFFGDFLMPEDEAEHARQECLTKHHSWHVLASCMKNAETTYRREQRLQPYQ
jgi:hypothetical protein